MRFGFFDQLPCASGDSEHRRYRDIIAQIELGDALGFDTVWLGELHFSRGFSLLADPLMVLAAAAQRTTRIRLGTAVYLLALRPPAIAAKATATLDALSGGRLIFGVGVSSQWKQWVLFINHVEFGIKDPQFNKDIGFYVFQLPFLRFIANWLFAGLVIVLLVTAVAHYLNGGIRLQAPVHFLYHHETFFTTCVN